MMLKIISMPRHTGKTTYLLNELKINPKSIFISANMQQADHIRSFAARQNNEWATRILSVHEYLSDVNKGLIPQDAEILVDELSEVLYVLLSREVTYVTITEEDKEYDSEKLFSFAP